MGVQRRGLSRVILFRELYSDQGGAAGKEVTGALGPGPGGKVAVAVAVAGKERRELNRQGLP